MPEPEQKQIPLDIKTRQRQHTEQMVDYLGELLIPVTEGFDQVNLDMTFANLGHFDLHDVRSTSILIDVCKIYGLNQSHFLSRGKMATVLASSRSIGGKSMDMFTTITTQSKQEFKDNTEKKKQSWFSFGKKKEVQ